MKYSSKINNFLETICKQIRWKKAHNIVSGEMESHILDQKDSFIDQGYDEETAIDMAIKEMGDPVLIGTELDRTHRPKTEWNIIYLAGIILLLGVGIRLFISYESDYSFMWGKNLASIILGIGCMIVGYFIDFTIIGRYPILGFIKLSSITILIVILSPRVYGRFTYVASMLLLYPIIMSGIIYKMRTSGYGGIIISGVFLLIPITIGMLNHNISLIFSLSLIFLILMTISILNDWFKVNKIKGLLLTYLPIISISLLSATRIISSGYIRHRLVTAINPYNDPMNIGYSSRIVREILFNSKFIGRGNLDNIYNTLPNINTDYILTYLIHRLGWIAFFVLMALILAFITYLLKLCVKQKSILGKLVSTSILLTFSMQIIFYTLNNLGFQLIASLTLPFISDSGMSIVINMTLIGIILSVFRTGDIVEDNRLFKEKEGKLFELIDGKIIIDLNSR